MAPPGGPYRLPLLVAPPCGPLLAPSADIPSWWPPTGSLCWWHLLVPPISASCWCVPAGCPVAQAPHWWLPGSPYWWLPLLVAPWEVLVWEVIPCFWWKCRRGGKPAAVFLALCRLSVCLSSPDPDSPPPQEVTRFSARSRAPPTTSISTPLQPVQPAGAAAGTTRRRRSSSREGGGEVSREEACGEGWWRGSAPCWRSGLYWFHIPANLTKLYLLIEALPATLAAPL